MLKNQIKHNAATLLVATLVGTHTYAFHQAGETDFKLGVSFVQATNSNNDASYRTYSYIKDGTTKEKHSSPQKGGMFYGEDSIDLDVAISYFVTEQIALEASTSFPSSKSKINYSNYWTTPGLHFVEYSKTGLELAGKFYLPSNTDLAPYIGAGVNYVNFSELKNRYKYDSFSYSRESIDTLFKAGFDYKLNDQSFFNFEIKQPRAKFKFNYSDAGKYDSTARGFDNADGDNATGTYKTAIKGKTKLKPFVVSMGFGFKF